MRMLVIVSLMLCFTGLSGAEPAPQQQKPQPIVVSVPKQIATFDPETGTFKYEKGGTPEELSKVLMGELIALSNKYQALEKSCSKKK